MWVDWLELVKVCLDFIELFGFEVLVVFSLYGGVYLYIAYLLWGLFVVV